MEETEAGLEMTLKYDYVTPAQNSYITVIRFPMPCTSADDDATRKRVP